MEQFPIKFQVLLLFDFSRDLFILKSGIFWDSSLVRDNAFSSSHCLRACMLQLGKMVGGISIEYRKLEGIGH